MKLTRRGQVAVVLVALSVLMGWQFGARALNAVAAPMAGALLVSAAILSRSESPTVTLSSIDPGFPTETRTLSVTLSGTGLAALSLSFPEGVDDERGERRVTLPDTVTYELELTGRGVHTIGPPDIALRSPLGLFERDVHVEHTTTVIVYPQLYRVDSGTLLAQFFVDELEAERQEFERLREYQPGDPLRHIHWKSSAKHDEFLVAEFAPSERDETVTIVGTAPKNEVDEMARLAATVTDLALDAGYNVELATPDGHVPAGAGEGHRENLLRLLARTGHGTRAPLGDEEADVEIVFARRELVVSIGGQMFSAETLFEEPETRGREETDSEGDAGSGLPQSTELYERNTEATP